MSTTCPTWISIVFHSGRTSAPLRLISICPETLSGQAGATLSASKLYHHALPLRLIDPHDQAHAQWFPMICQYFIPLAKMMHTNSPADFRVENNSTFVCLEYC